MYSERLFFGFPCVLFLLVLRSKADLPTCQPKDFHWEYTECDGQGGRWRVQVPDPSKCEGGAPKPPIRGVKCDQMCAQGEYLDVQGRQDCKKCPAGSYSLGGGVRYEDWDEMPPVFHLEQEYMGSIFSGITGEEDVSNSTTCQDEGWKVRGRELVAMPSDCAVSLVFTTSLVTEGTVKFVYQFEDSGTILHFKVHNSECSSKISGSIDRANTFPQATKDDEWKTVETKLPTGKNTLIWRVMGFGSRTPNTFNKPVKIKAIEITGIAFTQECTKCAPGTFSGEGASECGECPKDTHSEKGATECKQCDARTQYSQPGSEQCLERPACTERDYFEYHTPCDKNNQTQIQYKWIANKVCREDLSGSVRRPEPTAPDACPPCNPGMEMDPDGICKFCSEGLYSDGVTPCHECPASTAPEYAYNIEFWNSLPLEANITSNCLGYKDLCCRTETGWNLATNSIQTMGGHCDDAFLVFSIDVGGFRGQEQFIGGSAVNIAEITFVFETSCSADCTLSFFQQGEWDDLRVVETWSGTQDKQSYNIKIKSSDARQFTWVFQKKNKDVVANDFTLPSDWAKVYNIEITNTLSGGAVSCKKCPKGSNTEGCTQCPKNQYIVPNTTDCKPCPPGTILHHASPWGKEACMLCGEGLIPSIDERSQCLTDCTYTSERGQRYDFTDLSPPTQVHGVKQFTSSGTQFFHLFNISLCGGSFDFQPVICSDNITGRIGGDKKEGPTSVQSSVCRSTIIPPKEGEIDEIISAQPVSIGDILVQITTDGESLNMSKRLEEEGFLGPVKDPLLDEVEDVHFVYRSETPTSACGQGRSTIITLRCDMLYPDSGAIKLPPKCADATCDGCNMHFLWLTSRACPRCDDSSYMEIQGACVNGKQQMHYIAPSYCPPKAPSDEEKCSVLPFWLQVTIASMCFVAVLLCVIVVYCWNRNKTLEYKYMKLVTPSDGKDGELPAAETCALDEDDDEDEHFDAVQFKESKSNNFFRKIKNLGNKKGENPFESLSMEDREPLT